MVLSEKAARLREMALKAVEAREDWHTRAIELHEAVSRLNSGEYDEANFAFAVTVATLDCTAKDLTEIRKLARTMLPARYR